MITIETLPAEKFDELLKIEEGFRPDPEHSIALVARTEDHTIVGRMLLVGMAHVEGTWIAEGFRNGLLLTKLMARMEIEARKLGLKAVFAYSASQDVSDYLERLGYKRAELTVFRKDF